MSSVSVCVFEGKSRVPRLTLVAWQRKLEGEVDVYFDTSPS